MNTANACPTVMSRRRPVLRAPRGSFAGLLVAVALSMGSGACMLQVEAEIPDVQVTQHDLAFEGVPNGSLLGELAMGMSFTQERPALDLPAALDSSVQAVKVELKAKSGITDFTFLRALRVTMSPKGSAAEPIELINYERPAGAVVGATLSLPSRNPVNILEQWKADSAVFNLEVAGSLPEQAWTIDLVMHFAGKVSYKY